MQTRQRPRVCQIEGEIFFLFFFFLVNIFFLWINKRRVSTASLFGFTIFSTTQRNDFTDFMAKNLIKLVFFFPV